MPENLQPETMSTWMRDVERRLRAVESRSVPVGMPLTYRPFLPPAEVTGVGTAQTLYIPYAGRNAIRVVMFLDITGSGRIALQNTDYPGAPATQTFEFVGTATGTLTFDWDISDWATMGEIIEIRVQANVVNPGDEMLVYQPIGFECDVALFNATDDGNPVFA
jgi:hypothetical protein